MKKRPKIRIFVLSLCLLMLAGCGSIKPAQVPNRDLTQWTVTDPNSIGLKAIKNPDGTLIYNYNADFKAEPNNIIAFWKQEYNFLEIPVVRGQINSNTYPVVFDTGNSIEATILEDIHVTENNLPVFLFSDCNDCGAGMAEVADFKIGTLHAEKYPCLLLGHHTDVQFLGLPVSRSRHVIFPLILMSHFKYFAFDQNKYELRFSPEHSFEPDDQTEWISLPFEIQENHLLLSLELEGIQATLMMDTGAGMDLMLSEELIQKLYKVRPDLNKEWKRSVNTYGPYSEGLYRQRHITAKNIKLGNFNLSRCDIYSGKSYENLPYQGIIGFAMFKKTVLVLDFQKNLLWVQKAKGSRFEP